jgi:kumamolisin
VLLHHVPLQVLNGDAKPAGHYPAESKLRLVLAIQPPHMAEEEQFLHDLTTKGSPSFHQFLTPEQWNARFAPSAEDEQKVVDWAISQGFTVTHRYANRLLVDVEAPSAAIEKAFGVTMNTYQIGNEVDFSNDRDPVIPADLVNIVHSVLGLNSIERFHRVGSRKPLPKGPDYVPGPVYAEGGSTHADGNSAKAPANSAAAGEAGATMSNPTPADSYPLNGGVANPDSIQSSEAYNFNALQALSHCCNEPGASGGSPPESSIALVGYGNFNVSDVTTFFNNYGMAWNLNWYYINGTGYPGVDGEAPLDVEYAGAMSNSYDSYLNTAHIYEYEMPNGLYATYADAFNQIVSDNHAKVVSTSYGWEENVGFSGSVATGTMHPIFNTMVGEGFTLISAAGDNGSSTGCDSHLAVLYPASDSDFLAAGGTELLLDANGLFTSEYAWIGETWSGACASNHGGGGGGISTLFSAPYWQSPLGYTSRAMPDISLTANPDVMGEWYYSGGSWQDEGGTSIVAPELAGFFAQENSYLDWVGNKCGAGSSACSPVGLANPFFYEDAINGAPHNPFYDVTYGCTGNDDTNYWGLGSYCAGTGFDLTTGWGSANMLQLAWGINWELIPAYGNPSLTFSGPATSTWYNTNQTVSWTLSDAGSGSYPAPGVAGFTQGWDSIPADPQSEPHGGSGNSFYSGPQYPFGTSGCMAFVNNGCAGNSGAQGCHTVQVEGWDNEGRTTFGSYGPLCYDSVVPSISASTNPATSGTVWVDSSVVVTLTASDPGGGNASGIRKTYYAINTGACYPGNLGPCSVYSGPFTLSGQQQSYIYYFTVDNAGNYSTETYIWVSIDLTAPSTTASLAGTVYSGNTYESAVKVTLSASDTGGSAVHYTYYQLDGGPTITYTGSAFAVSALGSHSVKYWSVDSAGNIESAKTIAFSISSPTTASLVAAPNPSMLGQSVTMTATVKATLSGTPTGSVTFWNGATNLGTGTLSSGVATLSTTALPAGALTLQVSYAGAGNFLPTKSAPFDQTVEQQPQLLSPTAGTTLPGPAVTFTWAAAPGSSGYNLRLGTSVGANNLYGSGPITVTSVTPTNLPTNGETIYARLITRYGSSQVYTDYVFTAATQAALISPTPGTVLAGPSVTFKWTSAPGASGYNFRLGTTVGANNLYGSGAITTTSASPTNLPTNGETIYARLYTNYGAIQVYTDYVYTAAP